jgi:hypothetical protein
MKLFEANTKTNTSEKDCRAEGEGALIGRQTESEKKTDAAVAQFAQDL